MSQYHRPLPLCYLKVLMANYRDRSGAFFVLMSVTTFGFTLNVGEYNAVYLTTALFRRLLQLTLNFSMLTFLPP